MRFLASPEKIARSLDWKKRSGSILTFHLGKEHIDLVVTLHPSSSNHIQPLPSIPLDQETQENKKVLKKQVLQELLSIVEEWKVCGLVVSWPLQKEGWCGATCGKVLHVLDQIVHDTAIITPSRPVCLWDGHHFGNAEDEWGRLPLYAVPSTATVHMASQEQYRHEGMLAADIARDYVRFHWPELAQNFDSHVTAFREAPWIDSSFQMIVPARQDWTHSNKNVFKSK